jgi:hypothetical protein
MLLVAMWLPTIASVHPNISAALSVLDSISAAPHCLSLSSDGSSSSSDVVRLVLCPGQTITAGLGSRLIGRSQRRITSVTARQAQQWLTTGDGRLVPALAEWYQGGDACGGPERARRRQNIGSEAQVLYFCGGGAGDTPALLWAGDPHEARMWATRAEWMRPRLRRSTKSSPGRTEVLDPTGRLGAAGKLAAGAGGVWDAEALASDQCEWELHVGLPALCTLLSPPPWLERYERLIKAHPVPAPFGHSGMARGPLVLGAPPLHGGDDAVAVDGAQKRLAELADTQRLIERSWVAAAERGEMDVARLEQLRAGLREEAAISASTRDAERPRPKAVEALYDFTYGEISTEGGLAVADHLELDARSVVYDLGSGHGALVMLFALYGAGMAVGLELDATRHAAASRLKLHGLDKGWINPEEGSRMSLRNADAFVPGAFADATHIYMLSTCFGPHVFAQFLGAVGATETPSLRWVVSSRRILPRLLEQHNRGVRVRCLDTKCDDFSTTPRHYGARLRRQWLPPPPLSLSSAENRGGQHCQLTAATPHHVSVTGGDVPSSTSSSLVVAHIEMDEQLAVPTTFAPACPLYVYRVTHVTAAADGGTTTTATATAAHEL